MKRMICIALMLFVLLPICTVQAQQKQGVTAEQKTWEKLQELNWALFEKELQQGKFETWPIEEKHAWNLLEIEAGYTNPNVLHGLPDDKSMPREEALAIAQSLFEKAHPDAINSSYYRGVEITYNVIDPSSPQWEFVFVSSNAGGFFLRFPVRINAYTQEVTEVKKTSSNG